jgi:hypothetical protein
MKTATAEKSGQKRPAVFGQLGSPKKWSNLNWVQKVGSEPPIHPVPEAADYWQSEPQGTRARASESYVKPDGPPSGWTFGGHRSHELKTSESGNRERTGVAQIRLGGVAPN